MEDQQIHNVLKRILNLTSLEDFGESLEFLVSIIKSAKEDRQDAVITLSDSLQGVTELDTHSLAALIIDDYISQVPPEKQPKSVTKPESNELLQLVQIEKEKAEIEMEKEMQITMPVMSAKQRRKFKRQQLKQKVIEKKEEKKRFREKNLVFPGFRRVNGGGQKDVVLHRPSLSIGGQTIFEVDPECADYDNLYIGHGMRYGFIGNNGCGKSTFLRHLSCKAFPDDLSNISFYHVEQEIEKNDRSVLLNVLEADLELFELLNEEEELYNKEGDHSKRLLQIFDRLAEIEYDTAITRASTILHGLGFSPLMQKQPARLFSGGWLMRIALAKALFCSPDVLLLDEPTNHLDFHGLIWLENFLKQWEGTLIIVSHQQNFLSSVCNSYIVLHQQVIYISGSIPYLDASGDKWIEAEKRQRVFCDECNSLLQKNPPPGLARLIRGMSTWPAANFLGFQDFRFLSPPYAISNDMLSIQNCSFSYPPENTQDSRTNVFTDTSYSFGSRCRVAMVGRNGCGKTTLLKLLADQLQPTSGEILIASKLRVSMFTQEFVDQLDMRKTPRQYIQELNPTLHAKVVADHLRQFGLAAPDVDHRIELLSGGQKSRLAFAKIALERSHLLLLDEPTNHLDIQGCQSLCRALTLYSGAVIVVTHDEALVRNCCDELVYIEDGKLLQWKDSIDAYKNHVLQQIENENRRRKKQKKDLKMLLKKYRS